MSLDDALWDLLDAVHLGEFFDSHNIPPIVFPIMVVAIIGVLFFVLTMPPGAPSGCDKNGVCTAPRENQTNCPEDCTPSLVTPTSKTIKVQVTGGDNCETIKVVLKDGTSKAVLDTKEGNNWFPTFQSVTARSVLVEVSSSDSTKAAISSKPVNTDSEDTIRVTLDADFCAAPVTTQKGSIKVTVLDKVSGAQVGANLVLYDSEDTLKTTRYISGSGDFTSLDPGYYYFTATADGYENYYGKSDMALVEANKQASKTLQLTPSVAPPAATGKLEVCVSGDGQPIEHSGEIGVYDLEGELKMTGKLSDCPLFRGQATSAGCYIFTLPLGQYFAGVTRAPSGCEMGEMSGPYTVTESGRPLAIVNLTCEGGGVGSIRALVYINSTSHVVTENCTVELYYKNGSKIRTMNMSEDGDYTEYVELEDGAKVYVYAKNVPTGYLQTKSSTYEIQADENQTAKIKLDVPPPPLPNLTIEGNTMPTQVVMTNTNFTMIASAVKLAGTTTALTPTNGVSIACQNSWSTASAAATYNNSKWTCRMTSPNSVGQKTVSMKATKSGANPKTVSFTLYVVNKTEAGLLMIQEKSFSTPVSPVTLSFNITYVNASFTYVPVPSLQKSNLTITYQKSGGKITETVLTGSNGLFGASFAVPFKGVYEYTLNVSTVINNTLYWQFKNGVFTVLTGGSTAITCAVSPQLVGPSDEVNVTSSFTFYGSPMGEQDLTATVYGLGDPWSVPLAWNSTSKTYKATILTNDSECEYIVKCAAEADSSIQKNVTVYVANPNAAGANALECKLTAPSGCTTIADAEDCMRYWTENPALSSSYVTNVITCAANGLSACSSSGTYSNCFQVAKLKVKATKGSVTNTTDYRYFKLTGDSDGYSNTMSYTLPTISGGSGTISYTMTDLTWSGGTSSSATSVYTMEVNPLKINTSTGVLSATAFCSLSCGAPGDLDGDGVITTTDSFIMRAIIDTLQILGATPYSPWYPLCLDVTQDGYVTEEDLGCIDGLSTGSYGSKTDCPDCNKTSSLEICHDGIDDNCDGQTEAETYNPTYGTTGFYGFTQPSAPEDLCSCTSKTPCEMLYSLSGAPVTETSPELAVKRCVSLGGVSYAWKTQSEWKCDSSKAGLTNLACGGATTAYTCGQVEGVYTWTKSGHPSDTYPLNPLSSDPFTIGEGCQITSIATSTCGTNCNIITITADDLPGLVGETFGHTYSPLSSYKFTKTASNQLQLSPSIYNNGKNLLVNGLNAGTIHLTYGGSQVCEMGPSI